MKRFDFKPGGSTKKEVDWLSSYQQPHWRTPGNRGGRKYHLYRAAIALVIFMMFWAVKETQSPWGVEVKETLRQVLTSEWNYQPALQKVVQYGLQMANTDWPFFSATTPVISQTQGNSGGGMLPVPVSGKVVRGYGMVIDPLDGMERFHCGIDIAAPVGSAVRAVRDGRVKRSGDSAAVGKYVLLEHDQGSFTLYGQLARITVNEGQLVQAGQTIGEVGAAGDIPGGGLHFEMRENSKLIDPLTRLQPLTYD